MLMQNVNKYIHIHSRYVGTSESCCWDPSHMCCASIIILYRAATAEWWRGDTTEVSKLVATTKEQPNRHTHKTVSSLVDFFFLLLLLCLRWVGSDINATCITGPARAHPAAWSSAPVFGFGGNDSTALVDFPACAGTFLSIIYSTT